MSLWIIVKHSVNEIFCRNAICYISLFDYFIIRKKVFLLINEVFTLIVKRLGNESFTACFAKKMGQGRCDYPGGFVWW